MVLRSIWRIWTGLNWIGPTGYKQDTYLPEALNLSDRHKTDFQQLLIVNNACNQDFNDNDNAILTDDEMQENKNAQLPYWK